MSMLKRAMSSVLKGLCEVAQAVLSAIKIAELAEKVNELLEQKKILIDIHKKKKEKI
jgi:hypothetical protein